MDNPEAYREGYDAYLRGISFERNPYEQDSFDFWDWRLGWDAAEKAEKDDPYMYGGKDGRP